MEERKDGFHIRFPHAGVVLHLSQATFAWLPARIVSARIGRMLLASPLSVRIAHIAYIARARIGPNGRCA